MTTPDPSDVTAAELALGLLDGEERAVSVRRVLAEPDFAREVTRWRAHFESLFAEWPEVAPPPAMERLVLAAVEQGAQSGTVTALRRWRTGALALAAMAAALAGLMVLRPDAAPMPVPVQAAPSPLVAVVTPKAGAPFTAVFDRRTQQVRLAGGVAVPTGRDAELWAIGADGTPRALGLIGKSARATVAVRGVAVAAGTTLAISIEPLGGAPGPLPTGPVVATGQLLAV